MKNKITTFKQIKEIIEPIPADKFCTGSLGYEDGSSCYLGHIYRKMNKDRNILGIKFNNPNKTGTSSGGSFFGAAELTKNMLKEVHNIEASAFSVNDGEHINGYTEPVIKDRLMHMIEDGIKWEESKK